MRKRRSLILYEELLKRGDPIDRGARKKFIIRLFSNHVCTLSLSIFSLSRSDDLKRGDILSRCPSASSANLFELTRGMQKSMRAPPCRRTTALPIDRHFLLRSSNRSRRLKIKVPFRPIARARARAYMHVRCSSASIVLCHGMRLATARGEL